MKKFLAIALAALLVVCMIGCSKDEAPEIENDDSTTSEELVKDNFKYAVNEDGDYEIVGYITSGDTAFDVTLPTEIDGRPVTGIGATAFKALKVRTITIPEGYTYIAQCAFWNCTDLTEITLPNTITEIGKSAFNGCSNLTKVTFSSSLKTIDDGAFAYCEKLSGVVLPESLTTIGLGAFMDCDAIDSIIIPKNVVSIGKGAFVNCKTLLNVEFHEEARTNWYDEAGNSVNVSNKSDAAILFGNGTKLVRVVPEN